MTVDRNPGVSKPIETALAAFESGDAVAAASAFAADGEFVDPQYPDDEYRGRERIREAFEWALTNVPGDPEYSIRRSIASEGTCALEVETRLITRFGDDPVDNIPQVYIVDVDVEEARITSWRTYLPFPPAESSRCDNERRRE